MFPPLLAQDIPGDIKKQLTVNGEVQVKIPRQVLSSSPEIQSFVSIARLSNDSVWIFVTEAGYKKLLLYTKPRYVAIPSPNAGQIIKKEDSQWAKYHDYFEYLALMQDFADRFPNICKQVEIGESIQGRKITALKISDNVEQHESEPAFFYSSSIHGNETSGYNLMLRLIDYLLRNYHTDLLINELINNTEIYINPVANPDGLFYINNRVSENSKRFNVNDIDLNRNFPDPLYGEEPHGQALQQENKVMIAFMEATHFNLAANFHSGVEVVNYPWDTWEKRHPDDSWYQSISHTWADTVHQNSTGGYFRSYMFPNGVINGYDWYSIAGSRQDYMNYFMHSREVTIELHESFVTPTEMLDSIWKFNKKSLLNYIQHVQYGIHGLVTDTFSGNPVHARIEVLNHDFDKSWIYSDPENGDYYRLIMPGNYQMRVSAKGYSSKTVNNIIVHPKEKTVVNIQLVPQTTNIGDKVPHTDVFEIYPNPVINQFQISGRADLFIAEIIVCTPLGEILKSYNIRDLSHTFDLSELSAGIYIVLIRTNRGSFSKKIIKLAE